MVLQEGLPAWEEKGYALFYGPSYEKIAKSTILSPQELKALAETRPGSFILVDVREPAEFADGHIPGAINIPVTNFAAATGLDQGKKIILYCSVGARSYTAYRKLKKRFFPDVVQVILKDWQQGGFPIQK